MFSLPRVENGDDDVLRGCWRTPPPPFLGELGERPFCIMSVGSRSVFDTRGLDLYDICAWRRLLPLGSVVVQVTEYLPYLTYTYLRLYGAATDRWDDGTVVWMVTGAYGVESG
jgi:hypothetical protein